MTELYDYTREGSDDSSTPADQTQLKRRQHKKPAVNWWKRIVIAACIVGFIILMAGGTNVRKNRELAYNRAETAANCGDYITAYEVWSSLDGWMDSTTKAESIYKYACYQYGVNAYYASDYITAIYWLSQCREYEDTEMLIKMCIMEQDLAYMYDEFDDAGESVAI